MKNNSNSFDSSSQSNKSSSGYGSKKRNLKRMRKDQDGYKFENLDNLKDKEAYKKSKGMEEMKTSIQSEKRVGSTKTSYREVSSFDNHFQKEKEPSSLQRKKFKRMINSEEEEDHRSNSSSKAKYNRVKVKKIDDEEVGNFLQIPLFDRLFILFRYITTLSVCFRQTKGSDLS